jgi:hypothetical protein
MQHLAVLQAVDSAVDKLLCHLNERWDLCCLLSVTVWYSSAGASGLPTHGCFLPGSHPAPPCLLLIHDHNLKYADAIDFMVMMFVHVL